MSTTVQPAQETHQQDDDMWHRFRRENPKLVDGPVDCVVCANLRAREDEGNR